MEAITYTRHGDYFLPDIVLRGPPPGIMPPLGKYARIRQMFLKEYHPALYTRLLLSEQLYQHLRETDMAAVHRLSVIGDRAQAEEIINELIYE